MPSQGLALSPTLGNKREKKAATERKTNYRRRARLVEEDRYNAALELSIEEEKENEVYQSTTRDDEDEQFNLAMEGQTNKQF